MKDKFDNLENKEKKEINYRNEADDDYIFTEDQRQAALELQSLYRQLGLEDVEDSFDARFSVGLNDDPQFDIEEKLRDVNAQFIDDETPLESDRPRKVHFKESVVDLVVPISPLLNSKSLSPYYDYEDLVSSSEDEDDIASRQEDTRTPLDNGNLFLVKDSVVEEDTGVSDVESDVSQDKVKDEVPVLQEVKQEVHKVPEVDEIISPVENEQETETRKKKVVRSSAKNTRHVAAKCNGSSAQSTNGKNSGNVGVGRGSRVTNSEQRENVMPSYKGNARSPYGIPEEVKKELKKVRQVEVQQKRQKELSYIEVKQRRREEAERAYRAWLEIKRMQVGRGHSASPPRKQQSSSGQKRCSTTKKEEETEEALRSWLEHKAYQENKERIMRHLVQQEKSMMLQRSKRDDPRRAYTAWLKKKKDERQQFQNIPNYRSRQQVDMLRRTFHAYFGSSLLPTFI